MIFLSLEKFEVQNMNSMAKYGGKGKNSMAI
jgi:hypothetical protein